MSEITLFSELSSKDKTKVLIHNAKAQVLEGEVNPLTAAMIIKNMEDFAKALRGDALVQDAIIQEIERYGKVAEHRGMKFTIKEVGVSYDFRECQDPQWDFLNEQMEAIKEKMKERELFLKSLRKSETMVNDETGEVYTVYPPVKSSKTGYMAS